jgi:non-specific serine/threonine protein kinase
LRQTIDTVRLAGHLAQAVRPAGYDPEAVYLVTVLQNLGRLLLGYHFAEEAEQIHQLMQPVPAVRSEGEIVSPPQPGLDEEAAAYAVLGVTIDTLGNAAARHWGLGNEIAHMIRRLPTDAPVRKPDNDNELLRIVASAANEAIEALALPPPKSATALNEVVVRYARTLRLTSRVLDDALAEAREALASDGIRPSPRDALEETVDIGDLGGVSVSEVGAATALDREQHG